jgi:hypothetical protein
MSSDIKSNTGLIFMKVGIHDGEDFNEILERKKEEIRQTGMSFWGYGGGTCHPIQQVQPFAKMNILEGNDIYLVMEEINSHHSPTMMVAKQYSIDGITWSRIPDKISVRGSRYAIILDELEAGDLDIDLAEYEVAYGPSRGKQAPEYIKGRVDKACLNKRSTTNMDHVKIEKKINHIARLKDPYAVLVR